MDYYYQQLSTLKPDPRLSPLQVVQIQLEALQNNDLLDDDWGIRMCFDFASPDNQATTGPIGRFIRLVKEPLYRLMIGFERAEFCPPVIAGEMVQQSVRLIHTRGDRAVYAFVLSRQNEAPYTGCWMTDAVIPNASISF